MTNSARHVVRHAQARHALVRIELPAPDTLLVHISDDGVGFDVAAMRQRATEGSSMGLLGMQERATLVGAELTMQSAPGMGCKVTLRFPVQLAPAPERFAQTRPAPA